MKIRQCAEDEAVNLALDTIGMGKQALVFLNTRQSAEKKAEDIAAKIKTEDKILDDLGEEILNVLGTPTKQCKRLAKCVKKGIAFHHAGLLARQRELVEENFKNRRIKIICSTPSLSQGLDLPAYRVIIKDLKRYSGHGLNWILVLEYLQMSGRAGRPKYDSSGESITIAGQQGEKDEIYWRYITGVPEEIFSKLAAEPILRTYLLSLIAANVVNTRKSIVDFFGKTFWAYQYKDMQRLGMIIDKMLKLLIDYELIESSEDAYGFEDASDMHKGIIRATEIGRRVSELYIDPVTAHHIMICLQRAKEKPATDLSFLQMVSHTIEMMPLLRVRNAEYGFIEKELLGVSGELIDPEPRMYDFEYENFLNSFKTALFFRDWINEFDEEYLLENYKIRPGEVRAKIGLADWLLYSCEELGRMTKFKELNVLQKLRVRVKYGAKEEILGLLKLEGIGRIRARKLYNNKIQTIADVRQASLGELKKILGEKVALSVQRQVGGESRIDGKQERLE